MFNVTAAFELVPADWKDDIVAKIVDLDVLLGVVTNFVPCKTECDALVAHLSPFMTTTSTDIV